MIFTLTKHSASGPFALPTYTMDGTFTASLALDSNPTPLGLAIAADVTSSANGVVVNFSGKSTSRLLV